MPPSPRHPDGPAPATRRGVVATVLVAVQPTLARSRPALAGAVALVVAGVAAGAYLPQLVKGLLYKPSPTLVAVFAVLLVADPIANHLAHLRVARLALAAGYDLRNRVFAGVVRTTPSTPTPATRAGALTGTGPDVDRVEHGFEALLVSGLAGALRIVAALWFLSLLSLPAAGLMVLIVPLFLVVETRLSDRMVAADHARHDGAEHLSSLVDESVTAVSTARALPVGTWFGRRFARQAHHLDELSYEQMRLEARLHLGTRVVALAGLAAVTAFGVWADGTAGDLLAAILYIELAIIGVESLPVAARALQQAQASWARLQPLVEPDGTPGGSPGGDAATPPPTPATPAGQVVLDHPDTGAVTLAAGTWVAVVATDGDPSGWLAGAEPPPLGSVTVDGVDVALAARSGVVAGVPTTARCVDASVLDHLRAVDPGITTGQACALLDSLGVGQLADLPGGGLDAAIGAHGAALSIGERHRLLLAMALAAGPAVVVAGRLRPLSDPDVAIAVIDRLRQSGATVITVVDAAVLAGSADQVVFIDGDRWHAGTHHDLLVGVDAYVDHWGRPAADVGDLGVLADAGPLEREVLRSRMVTERYEPGDLIYRQGAPADRVVFIVSGSVEIVAADGTGHERRLALLGPGNACGDLRLGVDELRAETARAVDVTVVRTIGRAVWEAGAAGLLRADPLQRRILSLVLRHGAMTTADLGEQLAGDELATGGIDGAVTALLHEGALRQTVTGHLVAGTARRRGARTQLAMDVLGDLQGDT